MAPSYNCLCVCLTDFMIIILVCDTEHIGDIPVSLPQFVLTANMSSWAVEGNRKEVEV